MRKIKIYNRVRVFDITSAISGRIVMLFLLVGFCFSQQANGDVDWRAKWMTSYPKAKQLAGKEKKPLLLVFTDREDCQECVMLEGRVFATEAFAQWSREQVILMRVDLSADGIEGPGGKQSVKLREEFAVENLPVVVFVDGDGQERGRLEYVQGDSLTWIETAEGVIDLMPKPPVIEPMSNYRRARSQAAIKGLPMLVIVRDGGVQRVNQKVEVLYENKKMVELVEAGLVVVDLQWPDKKSGSGDGDGVKVKDEELFDGFVKQQKLKRRPIELFLMESRSGDVLYRSAAPPNPGKLASKITKSMPGLMYNGEWLSDYELGRTISGQTDRHILVFFGGSGWHKWTGKLKNEIFNTRQFKDYAKDRLVLVYLDYPQDSRGRSTASDANEALKKQFSVRSMSTLVLLNSQGGEVTRMGYTSGDVEVFIKSMDRWLN